MNLEEKWANDPIPFEQIKNDDLVCKTCAYLIYKKTASCDAYETKPVSVLKGGSCNKYMEQQDYYDGWDGLAEKMAKHCKVQYSQCVNCLNEIGTHNCKIYGEKPYVYASVLQNTKCPERIDNLMNIEVFKEKVIELQKQIMNKKILVHNEENTKQALINPFLLLLGYDVHNPNEVEFEYNASFSYKNSDRVDYAVKYNGKPIFFIEAKKVSEELSCHYAQLEYYLSTNSDVEIGILTNGIVYKFYAYFEKLKTMDKEPFLEFDFENMEDEKMDILFLFCKNGFDLNKLLKKGEELWYYRKITHKLKELLTKPSDEFIRLLAKDYSPTKITASTLEKFRPIVNKSITTAITDLTQESLVDETSEEKTKLIVTTDEELKAFEMTKKLLLKAHKDISNVDYKDTISYFGIYNRNVNGWFVRFVLDQQPTLVMIRLEYTLAKEIPTDLKLQPLKSKGITKVFIESVDDIHKLEPFILKAFEMVE